VNVIYEDVSLLDKSSPYYYKDLANKLKYNQDKTLSSMMSFSQKPTEDTPELIKAIYELREEDPSLFKNKRPGETIIDENFLNKLKAKR
jgi:hypothetical protein